MNTKDPVCGISVESATAAAQEIYQAKTYYFCSTHCRNEFKKAPQNYTKVATATKACCGGHHSPN